ncbi:MAG: hypothetical protein J6J11_08965 [Treponema sp.]|nr:hypothetical protein [Clostridia bacterium]MBP3608428.1 hypothetical protein [Treponema sp.]
MKNLFFDVSTKDSIEIFSKLYNKNSNYLCVFFHWNKDNILTDKKYVDQFENKFNIYVNWIDITSLYTEYDKINQKLKINDDILNTIKNYFILQLCLTYECKSHL